jgi:hypothetical protein
MSYPIVSKYDHLLECARAVQIAPGLDALPTTLKTLRGELEATNELIELALKSLTSERKAYEAERRRSLDARRHDYVLHEQEQRDTATQIAALREETVRLQNLAMDERRRFDKMVSEIKRMERQAMQPTVPQSPEAEVSTTGKDVKHG